MRKISGLLLVLFIMSFFSIASAHEGYPVYSTPCLQMLDNNQPPPDNHNPAPKEDKKHHKQPPEQPAPAPGEPRP